MSDCPKCGRKGRGKFCSECGTAMRPQQPKPSGLIEPGPSRVLFQAHQVSHSLPCYGIQVVPGLKLGYCEHAFQEFDAREVPTSSRFIAGTVMKVRGEKRDIMVIQFDRPPKGVGEGVTCGIEEYARFCIPAVRP